jgi:sugar phosphate isomerase/epimerase
MERRPPPQPQTAQPPLLSRSFKKGFPFTLATTSFIYPDDYGPNIQRLGPFLDEIELLLFESGSLPSRHTIADLADLSRTYEVDYNVHLPSDVSVGHADDRIREAAVASILRACERVSVLSPSTLTLHIPWEGPAGLPADLLPWKERVRESLVRLIAAVGSPAGISVETLDYPLEWLAEVIDDLGLAVCMDVGHLLLHGRELADVMRRFASRISILHLHGVAAGRDHLALDRLRPSSAEKVFKVLSGFKGIVSLEVFNFDDLVASLNWLEERFMRAVE